MDESVNPRNRLMPNLVGVRGFKSHSPHQRRTRELSEKIFRTAWEMKKDSYVEITIEITVRHLRMMAKHVNFNIL